MQVSVSRKRKLSSGSTDYRRPSTSGGLSTYYSNDLSVASSGTMLPTASMSSGTSSSFMPISAATVEADYSFPLSVQPGYEAQADFSTLTSKQTPPDVRASRLQPTELAYYALAAGQQRGGYLAYQSAPAVQPAASQAVSDNRVFAPLPRHAQGQQMSYQIQPRQISQSLRGAHSLSPSHSLRSTGERVTSRSVAMSAVHLLPPPAASSIPAHVQYSQSAMSSPLQQVQSSVTTTYPYSIPSFSPQASLSQADQATPQQLVSQPAQPASILPFPKNPVWNAHGGYYSSFSNSGLPGVVQWSNQPEQPTIYSTHPSVGQ